MDVIEPSLMIMVLLVLAAFVAGYIDTLVGGGGLITIPALMLAGLPPIFALGTNKLQAVAGSGTATFMMLYSGKLEFSRVRLAMITAFFGSCFGAVIVQYFDATILSVIIPGVIIVIALYFIFAPRQSIEQTEPKISATTYAFSAVPGIGLYDGMFGPGTGSFFVWSGVSLQGQAIVHSTMAAKAFNFATNVAALLVFAAFGKIVWKIGLLMMLGQAVGARYGARSLMSINPELLRYLVIAVCFIILIAWAI